MSAKRAIWRPSDIVAASAAVTRRQGATKAKAKKSLGPLPVKRLPPATATLPKQATQPAPPEPAPSDAPPVAPDEAKEPKRPPVEVGAQAIYEFRPHPKKVHWGKLADDKRAPFRARMKELTAAINAAGFQIRKT